MKNRSVALLLTLTGAFVAACGGAPSDEGVVARVVGYELTVDDVTQLLVDEERLPADRAVVERLAELWVDYTLLGHAATRDSMFGNLDFEPLVRRQLDQVMIFQLRDSVIQIDTTVSDAELRALYDSREAPMEIRARHILLGVPQGATPEMRAQVRDRLAGIRRQIVDGAGFEAMARQFSQDAGSAQLGGDLGFFARGDMFPPFEAAALALEPGQMSEVVETQIGFHLIRLEQKRARPFDEVAADLRVQANTARFIRAESTYVAGIEDRATPMIGEGALEVVRELARDPGNALSDRAARRAVFTFDGGRLTVRDVQEVLRAQPAAFRAQVVAGQDDEIDRFLRGLVQRKLLAAEAARSGFEPPAERVDSLVADARLQLRAAARSLGLLRPDRAPGEDLRPAVSRAVLRALQRVLSGGADVVELGSMGYQLRSGSPAVVYAAGVGESVLQVGQRRINRSASQFENTVDTTAAADSIGG